MSKPRILFVCPYPKNVAPSQRLKFEQYYDHFCEAGLEVEHDSFISAAFWKIIYRKGHFLQKAFYTVSGYAKRIVTLFRLSGYDVVYVHLWVTPFGPPFFEWLYRRFSKRLIYDIDDLIYLGNVKSKAHPLVGLIKGRKKPIFLMKAADHVITCTPHLDKFVRKYNYNTTDISSTINTSLYLPKEDYSIKKKFVIGWSGSYSTSKYLHLLDGVLQDLAKAYNFTLMVMGDEHFELNGVSVVAMPWKEEYEVEVIKQFDVGVYPLPDEEWVLGKSGLKALQYMALGIPTVATAIGTIFRIIEQGENGFLAKSNNEWKEFLISLIQDQSLREKIGKNAAVTVEKNYSVQANKETYLAILKQGLPA